MGLRLTSGQAVLSSTQCWRASHPSGTGKKKHKYILGVLLELGDWDHSIKSGHIVPVSNQGRSIIIRPNLKVPINK